MAWRQLDRLREPDRLRSWLVSIAANQARQALRVGEAIVGGSGDAGTAALVLFSGG